MKRSSAENPAGLLEASSHKILKKKKKKNFAHIQILPVPELDNQFSVRTSVCSESSVHMLAEKYKPMQQQWQY